MIDPAFAYAQARLQARHGERPDESVWRGLHTSRSLQHFLRAARQTSLAPWIGESWPEDADVIDARLRSGWREHVEEVAGWLPTAWQPAVLWCRTIVDLPMAGGGDVDPELEHIVKNEDAALPRRWSAHWQSLWPPTRSTHRRALARLRGCIGGHLEVMAEVEDDTDGWVLRADLASALMRIFRVHVEQPVATFCYLALVVLDLERLRGAMVRRLLLPDVRSTAAWV